MGRVLALEPDPLPEVGEDEPDPESGESETSPFGSAVCRKREQGTTVSVNECVHVTNGKIGWELPSLRSSPVITRF